MLRLPRLRRFLGSLTTGLCLLPLLQACGGRSDTEDYLFGVDGSGATSSGATGSGAAASGATTGVGADSSGANGSGANGSGANGSGAGGGTGPIGEGGFAVGGTAVGGTGQGGSTAGSGSAGEPSGPRVSCGDTTCDASDEACCAGLGGFACIRQYEPCNGAVLSCSSSSDCGGDDVCCLIVVGEVGGGSECKANCQSMGMFRERQLCSTDAECPFEHCRETVFGVKVCTRR